MTGKLQPTLAGWWLGCVSLPFVQFILLRWYFRLLIWTRFLWQVSRIDLRLVAIHPDRAGGLGFLSTVTYAFAPLLAGQGVLLAGVMANKIFYAGAKLTDFKLELLAMVIMMLFFVLAPLLVFTPRLARTKRIGLVEYGGLAQRYVREFDQKWLRDGATTDEPLVGSGDIQSLADLGNSFEIVKGMKPVPFGKETLLQLAVISLAPVAPLVLTHDSIGRIARPLPARCLLISKDNRPQLSAVASPPPEQHLCCAKIIVIAAINGQDKLQLFSCISKRQERERFFHGCNIFVTAAVHMLDLSPIWQALAIRRALPNRFIDSLGTFVWLTH